jgi:hypothetical protein
MAEVHMRRDINGAFGLPVQVRGEYNRVRCAGMIVGSVGSSAGCVQSAAGPSQAHLRFTRRILSLGLL